MKTFCILEQGKDVNLSITLEKKKLFTTPFSDFYRLNWAGPDDPNAFIHRKNITWSEGRSLLYEFVPKEYDYYIFIDDDIRFVPEYGYSDVPQAIKGFLEEYKPVSGCFWSKNWHNRGLRKIREVLRPNLRRKVFPYMGQDLECIILSKSFADVMFPVIYHGCWGSLWYINFSCNKLYPGKQLCFSGIRVLNEKKYGGLKTNQHFSRHELTEKFNAHLLARDFPVRGYHLIVPLENLLSYFFGRVSKEKVDFSINDFAKIYDVTNNDFANRGSTVRHEMKECMS